LQKARITVTITKDVDLNPELYYTDSVEDMLTMAIQYADNMLHEFISEGIIKVYAEGKLIEEK
jgi:hypothetical protein